MAAPLGFSTSGAFYAGDSPGSNLRGLAAFVFLAGLGGQERGRHPFGGLVRALAQERDVAFTRLHQALSST